MRRDLWDGMRPCVTRNPWVDDGRKLAGVEGVVGA